MNARPSRSLRRSLKTTRQQATAASPPAADLRRAEARWQRTARYGWDKGGSRGGR
ncbi:MAG TPA: hypothetical protein PLO14_04105 [Accumulibacter sp.]|uniref:hypothetical protein n=1 Tax=Accumulibacter sp. TaxID=2053492 RepID=UPI0025D240D4|nr:hypothetical protein [Accumulibacter sp.]MCM8598787.1 hypothetical protein [Accumulibacter sp.]HNC51414.1 hypothetical protein [Accumulibacter sp.]